MERYFRPRLSAKSPGHIARTGPAPMALALPRAGQPRLARSNRGQQWANTAAISTVSAAERPLAEAVEVDLRTIEHRKAAVEALKGEKEVGAGQQNDLRTAIMVQSLASVEKGLPLRSTDAPDGCHLGIVSVHFSQGLAFGHEHGCRGDRPITAGLHYHAGAEDPNRLELAAPDLRGNERDRIQKRQR